MPLLALIPAAVLADCYTLPDADARTLCQARQRNDPGQCYAIHHPDRRSACLAEFRRDRYWCSGIQDPAERARCELGAHRYRWTRGWPNGRSTRGKSCYT